LNWLIEIGKIGINILKGIMGSGSGIVIIGMRMIGIGNEMICVGIEMIGIGIGIIGIGMIGIKITLFMKPLMTNCTECKNNPSFRVSLTLSRNVRAVTTTIATVCKMTLYLFCQCIAVFDSVCFTFRPRRYKIWFFTCILDLSIPFLTFFLWGW
jgi:hypothetical protein